MATGKDIIRGAKSVKLQPLYDSLRVAAAGTVELQFFKNGINQDDSAHYPGTKKRLIDTNLRSMGRFTNGERMDVKGIVAKYKFPTAGAATNVADLEKVLYGAELTIEISDSKKLRCQLMDIPSACGITGFAATTVAAATAVAATVGVPDPRAVFHLYDRQFAIENDQSIDVAIKWGAAPALTNPVVIVFQFVGDFYGDIVG